MFTTCMIFCLVLGNLMKEEEVLDFLISQLANDEIEDVNENTLDKLIETNPCVAVFFCK